MSWLYLVYLCMRGYKTSFYFLQLKTHILLTQIKLSTILSVKAKTLCVQNMLEKKLNQFYPQTRAYEKLYVGKPKSKKYNFVSQFSLLYLCMDYERFHVHFLFFVSLCYFTFNRILNFYPLPLFPPVTMRVKYIKMLFKNI